MKGELVRAAFGILTAPFFSHRLLSMVSDSIVLLLLVESPSF